MTADCARVDATFPEHLREVLPVFAGAKCVQRHVQDGERRSDEQASEMMISIGESQRSQ